MADLNDVLQAAQQGTTPAMPAQVASAPTGLDAVLAAANAPTPAVTAPDASAAAPADDNTIGGRLNRGLGGIISAGTHAVAHGALAMVGGLQGMAKWGLTGDGDAFVAGQDWASKTADQYVPVTPEGQALSNVITSVHDYLNALPGTKGHIGDIVTQPGFGQGGLGDTAYSFGEGIENQIPALRGKIAPILGTIAGMEPSIVAAIAGTPEGFTTREGATSFALSKPGAAEAGAAAAVDPRLKAIQDAKAAQAEPVATSGAPQPTTGTAGAQVAPQPTTGTAGAQKALPIGPVLQEGTKFSQIGPEGVGPVDLGTRAQVASEVMGDEVGQVRPSVLSGTVQDSRNELTKAFSPIRTDEGNVLAEQFAAEERRKSGYGQETLTQAGADPNMVTPTERGNLLRTVLSGGIDPDGEAMGLMGAAKKAKDVAYNQNFFPEANATPAIDTPIRALLSDTGFLGDLKSANMTGLAEGTLDHLNSAMSGPYGPDVGAGTVGQSPGGTVGALERLRQRNNSIWTEENADYIKRMNGAIDQAIDNSAQAAGNGKLTQAIQDARAIHQAQQTVIGSEGIKSLTGPMGPNGVVKKGQTADEDVMGKLNTLKNDQHAHVADTLLELSNGRMGGVDLGDAVSPNLRLAAKKAYDEIGINLMREAVEAGNKNAENWSSVGFSKIKNARQEKMNNVLSPESLRRMEVLDTFGKIAPGRREYEGADFQKGRGEVQGVAPPSTIAQMTGQGVGAAIGGTIGSFTGVGTVPGAWVGKEIGGAAVTKGSAAWQNRALRKNAAETIAKMQKNYALGKSLRGQ